MTTPIDPQDIPKLLLAHGWVELNDQEAAAVQDDVDVANLGAQNWLANPNRPTGYGSEDWVESWAYIHRKPQVPDERDRTFRHSESGAILVFSDYSWPTVLNFRCLLAVPNSATKASSYFPKLSAPTAPAISLVVGEFLSSDTIRSTFMLQSASLDTDGIRKALNIETEVGAAFHSWMKYPKMSVAP